MNLFRKSMFLMIVSFAVCFAEGDSAGSIVAISANPGIKLKIGGMFSIESGQLIDAYFNQTLMNNRPWLYRGVGQIRMNAKINDHVAFVFAPQIRLWYDSYTWEIWANEAFAHPFTQRSTASFAEAQGTVSFGVSDDVSMNVSAGIMPFKYSPSKNLGEYLYRSGARPCFVYTDFDYPYATLTGLKIGSTLFRNFTANVLLTTETMFSPTLDWSLSGLIDYSVPTFGNIGAGINFDRLFPVTNANKPKDPISQYMTKDKKTEYFSFGGTKLMGHVTIDPKGFLSDDLRTGLFGKEDLKIYCEVAVLGLQNIKAYVFPQKYAIDVTTGLADSSRPIPDSSRVVLDTTKAYYANIWNRIPITVGINFPTFKILDYLSLEAEYFPWPYPNSTMQGGFQLPAPVPSKPKIDASLYWKDNIKYSVNAKATVFKSIAIIGQIARDNTRSEVYDPTKYAQNCGENVFILDKGWGWWLKLQYSF